MFFEQLPTTIKIQNIEYVINTDFRVWIKFGKIVKENKGNEEKLADLLQFLAELNLPTSFKLFNEIIDQLINFYSGEERNKNNISQVDDPKEYFDFELDSPYIYASFLSEYNINLTKVDLHWWEFKSLFQSLSSECIFSKIIHYRSINLKDVPKEQKDFYRKMKKIYTLEKEESQLTVEEYHQQIINKVNSRFEVANSRKERRK